MTRGPFHPQFDALPSLIPIFPLNGVLLLPGAKLPLNIFEPRYLNMVLDCLGQGRTLGMVQPTEPERQGAPPPKPFDVGCLGRIVSFSETGDGRFLITLEGVCRFKLGIEVEAVGGYRRICPDYRLYRQDLEEDPETLDLDRRRLMTALRPYFQIHGMEVNWKGIEAAPDGALVTTLASICPFEPREKQALLEAPALADRASVLLSLLEMAVLESRSASGQSRQ